MTNQRETPSWWSGALEICLGWNLTISRIANHPTILKSKLDEHGLKGLLAVSMVLVQLRSFIYYTIYHAAPFPSTIEEYASLPANFIRDRFLPPFVIGKDQ